MWRWTPAGGVLFAAAWSAPGGRNQVARWRLLGYPLGVMRVHALSAVIAVAASSAFWGCGTAESDSLSGACEVIVNTCHKAASMSDCIDQIGSMDPSCLNCIASSGCDYPSCQVSSPVGCRLPLNLE